MDWRFWRKKDSIDGYSPPEPSKRDPWREPGVMDQMAARAHATQNRHDAIALDGFKNELTGIGDWTRDKTMGGRQGGLEFELTLLSNIAAEYRWRGSDLGARIVELIPDEMTREGWEFNVQPTDDEEDEPEVNEKGDAFRKPEEEQAAPRVPGPLPEVDDSGAEVEEAINGTCDELRLVDAISEALRYERAYGGGAILMDCEDGLDPSLPLDEKRLKKVHSLNTFTGGWDGEMVAWSYYQDPMHPKYGQPEVYMLRNIGVPPTALPVPTNPSGTYRQPARQLLPGYGAQIFWVHESRLIVFKGTSVSRRARIDMRGWGDSLFSRVDEVLAQYGQTWGGIANLMTDFSQGVLAIEGLAEIMAANNKSGTRTLQNRAMALQLSRSIARTMLIDSKEAFTRETVSLAGIADVLQQFARRLAAACDMPESMLFGQGGASLNKGDNDVRFFYDRVASRQRRILLPQIKRFIRLLLISKEGPTRGKEPERWTVKMNPLYQMTEREQAELRKMVAETDAIYMRDQVVSPEEICASRFGGSEWTMETTIDLKGRKAMAETTAKTAEEQTKAKHAIMSESAKAGVEPHQLSLEHPEHPKNSGVDPRSGAPHKAPPEAEEKPEDEETPVPDAPVSAATLTPSAQSAVMTVNEARKIIGLAPMTGGDVLIVQKQAEAQAEAQSGEEKPDPEKPETDEE